MQVVCFLWSNGTEHPKKKIYFGPRHVNTLRAMVKRHLRLDHEFVCITDMPLGIDPDIRIVPLWKDYRDLGGCFVRLKAYAEEMREIIGERFCMIDLDTVIVRDITPLFDTDADFKIWADTHPQTPFNGSCILMTAGARKQVWEEFTRNPKAALERIKQSGYVGTDQAFIGCILSRTEQTWNCKDGMYSWRVHLEPQGGNLPLDARIVFHHGSSDPSQPALRTKYHWIRRHWTLDERKAA